MAVREIKTTIALEGEQEFKQALASANREMRNMDSELKAVTAAYKANGDGAEYFARRQQNLQSQIRQQEEIVRGLEDALTGAKDKYGENSKEVDKYTIQLNNARTKLYNLQRTLSDADREMEELGRDSTKAGRQIRDGVGDSAEAAERDVRDLAETIQDVKEDLGAIRSNTAASALSDTWSMASGVYSSVSSFVEGTMELRRQMSFLEQQAANQDYDYAILQTQMAQMAAITGSTSAAVEALGSMLALGLDETQMTRALENLGGAVINFPSMSLQSLAESLQETLATDTATGQFGELLVRLGVKVEDFNAALANSETEAGDFDIAMAYLAQHGMAEVYDQWTKNNQSMVDAMSTQTALEMELAEFGGTLEKYIVTPVKVLLVDALGWVNDQMEDWEKSKTGQELIDENQERRDQHRDALLQAMEGYVDSETLESVTTVTDALKLAKDVQKKTAEAQALQKMQEREFVAVAEGYVGKATITKDDGTDYSDVIAATVDKLMQPIEVSAAEATEAQSISILGRWKQLIEDAQKEIQDAQSSFEAEGEEAGKALESGFETGAGGLAGKARILGMDAADYFAAGMMSRVSYVASSAAQLALSAAQQLNMARTSSAQGSTKVVMAVDGREMADALVPYLGESMYVSIGE